MKNISKLMLIVGAAAASMLLHSSGPSIHGFRLGEHKSAIAPQITLMPVEGWASHYEYRFAGEAGPSIFAFGDDDRLTYLKGYTMQVQGATLGQVDHMVVLSILGTPNSQISAWRDGELERDGSLFYRSQHACV